MEAKTPASRWIMLALRCEAAGLFALFLYYAWQRNWLPPVAWGTLSMGFLGSLFMWGLNKRTVRELAMIGWCVLASVLGSILFVLLAYLSSLSLDARFNLMLGGAFLETVALAFSYPARDTPAGRWGGRIAIGWVGGLIVLAAIFFIQATVR